MAKQEQKDKRRKVLLGILFLFGAGVMLTGSLLAFFSDYISGSGSVTAGTLNIGGTFQYYVNGSSTAVTSVANFNPGDVVVAKATVFNTGNKSAWLQTKIDFGTLDAGIAPYIEVYQGEYTYTSAAAATGSKLTLASGVATTDDANADGKPDVINGKTGETDSETETAANGIATNGSTTGLPVAFTIRFLNTALNSAQGQSVSFTATVNALQYRNNPSPNWAGTIEQKL